MSGSGNAFAKGGIGCIVAFIGVGLLCVLLGGSIHINLGGIIILFVIGGVIGLIVFSIYNKGVQEGRGGDRRDRGNKRWDDHKWDDR